MAAPRSEGHALAFLAGDLVDVKGRGRAIVLETAGSAPAAAATAEAAAQAPHPFAGRVHVRFHEDGTTYWVNPARLRRMRPASARIVVAYRTELYRAAIIHNVEHGSCCLEVGSHTGSTTALLHKRCGGRAVGVDNVPLMVQGARQRFPAVRFELADGSDVAALRALSPNSRGSAGCGGTGGSSRPPPASDSSSGADISPSSSSATGGGEGSFDVICVDLSGKAPLAAVVPLLDAYMRAWPAARLIVKNEALFCAVEAWQQQRGGSAGEQDAGDGQRPQEQQQQQQQQRQEQADDDAALLSELLACWRLDGGSGASCDGATSAVARQLAAVLHECELFRSEGFLSHTDKPLNKAKDRRCRYCRQDGIGKWKEHNRQCAAKQAAKAARKEALVVAAAAETGGRQSPSPP